MIKSNQSNWFFGSRSIYSRLQYFQARGYKLIQCDPFISIRLRSLFGSIQLKVRGHMVRTEMKARLEIPTLSINKHNEVKEGCDEKCNFDNVSTSYVDLQFLTGRCRPAALFYRSKLTYLFLHVDVDSCFFVNKVNG